MDVRQEKDSKGTRAAKRAAIIREYASIDGPSAAQTETASAKLGISTSRLHQLVRAWVAHGQTSMATGTLDEQERLVGAAIAATEGDLDMSGVPEIRRAEIERRIRLIGRYLRTGSRDRVTTQGFVEEYGSTYNTFRSALNVWLLSRTPALMPGAAVTAPGRRKGPVIDKEGEAAVRQVADELGRTAGLTAVHRRVAEICNAEGLKRPSAPTVYRWLMAIRNEPMEGGRDDAVCLDRVSIESDAAGEHREPLTLTLLFGSTSGRILAHLVDEAPPSPASDARVIADLLASGGEGACITIEGGMPPGSGWDDLIEVLRCSGVSLWYPETRSLASGTLALKTFGNRIGGIRIKRLRRDASRPPSAPETMEVMRNRVESAVAAHNADRSHDVGPLIGEETRSSLLHRLEALVADQSS